MEDDVAASEKLVIIATHGIREPERATIPFVMAGAALASDVAVTMAFQADAIELLKAGAAETVVAAGFPPLAKLFSDVQALGASLLACSPCMTARGIVPADLVDGAEVVAAGRLIAEITSATSTLTY
jgi:predicted peroxiredoxin